MFSCSNKFPLNLHSNIQIDFPKPGVASFCRRQSCSVVCVCLALVFIARSAKVSSPSQNHQSPVEMKWEKAKWANTHLYTRAPQPKHEKHWWCSLVVQLYTHTYVRDVHRVNAPNWLRYSRYSCMTSVPHIFLQCPWLTAAKCMMCVSWGSFHSRSILAPIPIDGSKFWSEMSLFTGNCSYLTCSQ